MSDATMQHTPAGEDVRERAVRLLGLAMERAEWLCRDVGRAEWPLSDFDRDMLQERLDTVRDLIGDALAALRSEAQGEDDVGEVCHLCGEEFDPSGSGTVTGPLGQDDGVPRWYRCPRCAWAYDAGYQRGQRDPRGDETALLRTPRGEVETMDADEMWFHWSSGHESAALLGLRTASDDEAHRFLDMLARWQKCPKPSDHAARQEGGSDG